MLLLVKNKRVVASMSVFVQDTFMLAIYNIVDALITEVAAMVDGIPR